MASYEESAGVVIGAITDAAAKGEISQETADAITAIVEELNNSGEQATIQTTTGNITSAAEVDGNIVMMGKDQSIQAEFTQDAPVQAIVVGGGGNSNVVFNTTSDVTVQLQGGENDSVSTGEGNDSVTFTGGTATIDTGAGNDTVVLQGDSGHAQIQGGAGNMEVVIDTDQMGTGGVTASIDAGDGFDAVAITQGRAGHFFDFVGGVFRMIKQAITGRDADIDAQADGDVALTMQNVNVVKFNDADGNVDEVTVLASNEAQGLAARMYQIVRGEQQAVDVQGNTTNIDGLQFWIDTFGASTTDAELDHLAMSMLKSGEFDAKYGAMSNEDFANAMFANLNAASSMNIQAVDGMTAADIVAQLNSGAVDKYDVAMQFANSQQAVEVMGSTGNQYVIDGYSADAQ